MSTLMSYSLAGFSENLAGRLFRIGPKQNSHLNQQSPQHPFCGAADEGPDNFRKRFLTLLGRKLVEFGKDFHARQVKLRRHLKRYKQQFPFHQTYWHSIPDAL
jgi:hypothetical protein